jgi:hypothetical protein
MVSKAPGDDVMASEWLRAKLLEGSAVAGTRRVALTASTRAARWDLTSKAPTPRMGPRQPFAAAIQDPAGSCLQLHHDFPNKILAYINNVLVDTVCQI